MSCRNASEVLIAGEPHVVECELPADHTGVHRVVTETGALLSWMNTDHCPVYTEARGTKERCRLRINHGSPHMTEDGAHLWLLDGSDTVLAPRERATGYERPAWQDMFGGTLQYGGGLPIRLEEAMRAPEQPAETRTEEAVARTYKQRKKGKKR